MTHVVEFLEVANGNKPCSYKIQKMLRDRSFFKLEGNSVEIMLVQGRDSWDWRWGIYTPAVFYFELWQPRIKWSPALLATALLLSAWSFKILITLNNQDQQYPFSPAREHRNFFLQERQLTNLAPFKCWRTQQYFTTAMRAMAVIVHYSSMKKESFPTPCQTMNKYTSAKFKSSPRSPRPSAGSSDCPSEFCIMGQRLGVSLCWVFSSWES